MSHEHESSGQDPDRRIDQFLGDLHRMDHPDPPGHLAKKIVRGTFQNEKHGVGAELLRIAAGILVAVAATLMWTSMESGMDIGPLMNTANQVINAVNDSVSTGWIEHFLRF